MYRIAICDDNKHAVSDIHEKLHVILKELKAKDALIDCYYDGKQLLDSNKKYHMFILDIMMPGIDGLSLGREIKKRDPLSIIIFLTNSDDYMKESFSVEPIRYLSKPIDIKSFKEAIHYGIEKIRPRTVAIKDVNGIVNMVNYRNIKYIQSEENYCQFYVIDDADLSLSRGTLVEWERKLPHHFIRVSRAHIVNLQFVKKINHKQGELLLSTGEGIGISKSRVKRVDEALKDNLLEKFRRG